MSFILLGILLLYIFLKLCAMDSGKGYDDDFDDYAAMNHASSIARGDDPLDPNAQYKSATDPLDLFGDD